MYSTKMDVNHFVQVLFSQIFLLFGSEGYGIKAKTLENSDFKFKVHMNDDIESLNISNTVSIVCHHIFQSIK